MSTNLKESSFLKEILDLTMQANIKAANDRVLTTVKYCKEQIKAAAGQGKYMVYVPLCNVQAQENDVQSILNHFHSLGFKGSFIEDKDPKDNSIGYELVKKMVFSWS